MADSVSAAVQQPAFDVAGARKAGYSDGEIASYLAGQSHFDLDGAKQAGYNDNEIVGFLSHPTIAYAKPETKQEDTFLGSVGKGIESIPSGFKQILGGAERFAGEHPDFTGGPEDALGQAGRELTATPEQQNEFAEAGKDTAARGAQIYREAAKHIRDNAPNVSPGSAADYAYKVTSGLGELLPVVALTLATRNPAVGGLLIGGQAEAEKYGEARESGRAPNAAGVDAGFTGLVNGAMATIPLGALMKPGQTFLGKTLAVAGANAFQGIATEALQQGYDAGIVHQDMPLGEAVSRIKDAGIVGAVTGALLGAGEHGLSHLGGGGAPPGGQEPAPPAPRQAPTPEAAAAPVLAAPTVDAAIQAAQAAVHSEPIDIEAMGRTAQMQAQANAAAGTGERGVNDLLSDLDMQGGQIEQEAQAAPAQPQEAAPAQPAAAVAPPQEAPAPAAEQPLAAMPEPDQAGLPSLADTTTLQGRVRGAPRRVTNGPVDAATFLAMKGGIRNDEGHDLTAGRGLQQFVPGVGPLIRPGGMSMDYAGEALHEAGYFGAPESTPRPTENEVLQMLEQTGRDAQGRPGKVYTPEDQARLDEAQQTKHATDDNARALQDVHDEARALGESLEPHEADQVAAYMGEHGLNPEAAVGEFLERKYSRLAEEYHEQTGDSAYAEASPVTRGQGEIDLGHGEGLEGQEAIPFPEGGSGEGRDAVAADTEPARQLNTAEIPPLKPHVGSWFIVDRATGKPVTEIFRNDPAIERLNTEKYKPVPADEWLAGLNRKPEIATERGAAGLDQTIIPGAEASARQLAQAREDAGHGRIQPRAQQKPADSGLFGEKPSDEPTMFARRDEEPAPPFFSGLTRAVEGVKMEKAPPGQWEATIKNLPGVKAEELDWSGVNDWLRRQTRSVTKAEVLQHLRENEVQVKEIEKGKPDLAFTVSSAGGSASEYEPPMRFATEAEARAELARREGVMQGQPLFARNEEGPGEHPGGHEFTLSDGTKLIYSDKPVKERDAIAAEMRAYLDSKGFSKVAAHVADIIIPRGDNPKARADGFYISRVITAALDAKNRLNIVNHEIMRAARALKLFSKSEWSILEREAQRVWLGRYKKRLDLYGEGESKIDAAVAMAHGEWASDPRNAPVSSIAKRLFQRLTDFIAGVGRVLIRRGFDTPESIFRKISRGEIAARDKGTPEPAVQEHIDRARAGDDASVFARRSPPTEDEIYRDGVSDLISTASEGEGTTNTGARLLTKISEAGIKQLKNVNPLEGGSYIGSLFPRTLASLDDMSARLWRPWMAREEETHANVEKLRRVVSKSLVSLSAESRDRVYAALELARKWEWRPPDDGRPIRVRNTSYWQAQKSKVGDDYVLNPTETRAFHDSLKLGDEGWRMFMSGLAKREGWNGPVDASMIRAAANQAGEGLPEGKRLLRLAGAIEAAQAAINRPYFPAMRFGDYFIAVKPKIGTEENSLGGYPKVEWFETVEKPALQDMLGKARLPAADTPGVKEALERIKARTKADGSPAFTDETHDFEIGDLRSRPNILRQLNIPAIEKLFMLMERGVTNDLRDKIMATNTPEEGATGKEAAGIKQEAGEAAKAHYEATLGETKDILMDAVYHDLLSGWKKSANMVPGYSSDFDRAIGTHMYQVGRNSADMVYRNSIEDAYQNIQDNHPHASTKQYWQHWRQYQETPQDPLSRAAGKTAQIGAAYVMGLNPSTTMMISAHTPIMATPVLGVGGGMGQATAQMSRAIREVYKALSFDKKKGAFIDADQLGRTPREKALIAELDRTGLNHSLGADDVRNINDRQAGLWGSARPTMKKALDIAMSNVSAVDQANRNAIALAAHRMAMNPATLEKMAKPWMEHNAIFRQMVMDEGLTPESFTKFMMSEAAGAWGCTNQAVAMRGAEGSLLFALHGFQTRFLSTAWKLMFNMGPSGRVAAGWMMAALWAGTGVYGLPFTQDMENAGDLLWKSLTGVDPMIDAHVRQFLGDAGLGKTGTEILLRGPLSVMLGIDLQSRLGFGDVITRSASATDLLGTIPSIFFGKMVMAANRERTGQGTAAAAAELLPAALRNPARAMIEKEHGQQSQQGTQLLRPEDITASHTILRSLGLPPLAATQAQDRSEYMRDLTKRDEELRHHTEESAANLIIEAGKADREGDAALAHELSEQVGSLLGDYNRDHWQAPVTQEGLSDAILQHTNPEIYRLKKTPGRLRGEAYRNPY